MVVPGTRESFNEDLLTSYILRDEAMQEAEMSTELLPHANYVAPTKHGSRAGQRGKPGGSGSGAGRPAKDSNKAKSAKDGGRGGGSRRRECWLKLRKEKQSTKSTSAKDADSSTSGKGRGDGEASCSLVGFVEPTVSLASEAGEDFQAVTLAVQANPAVVLLDSGCSHHLMGTKAAFVDLKQSGVVKHVTTDLKIKPSAGTDAPCVSCIGGKLARHTFPDKGSDADDALAVVHIDLCGPFGVASKDGSLYFLLLKDCKTHYVWVRPVAKKSDVLGEFEKGVPWEGVCRRRGWQGNCPRPDLPLHTATEWHGGAGDADGGGVGAIDAVAYKRAAPLVAPCSAVGRMGSQLPGEVDPAAGDDPAPSADRQEARPDAGLYGAAWRSSWSPSSSAVAS
ncbi:unnamed protein product [Closterium sp. NIES-53]